MRVWVNGERRFGLWAGNEKGLPEDMALCAEEVGPADGWVSHQCSRKRGHGPEGEYCKQHAKMHIREAKP